jgi:hypothetical protein
MMPLLIAVLRVVHVVAASFWLGAALMNAGFLLPAVRASGPAGGQVMKQIVQVRRLPTYLNIAVGLALLSGALLYWWLSGGFASTWLASVHGLGLVAGALLGIVAALVGWFVNAPTAKRFAQLAAQVQAAGRPPSEEELASLQGLQQRLLNATRAGAVLLVLAAAAMAAARYL